MLELIGKLGLFCLFLAVMSLAAGGSVGMDSHSDGCIV